MTGSLLSPLLVPVLATEGGGHPFEHISTAAAGSGSCCCSAVAWVA